MANRIQLRRGTAAQWTATNPVLAQGEPGIETDTGKQKFGNGVSGWNALPYASKGDTGLQGPPGVADDASIAAQINNTGSTTRAALNATTARAIDTALATEIPDAASVRWYRPLASYQQSPYPRTLTGAISSTGKVVVAEFNHGTGRQKRVEIGTASVDDHNPCIVLVIGSMIIAMWTDHDKDGKMRVKVALDGDIESLVYATEQVIQWTEFISYVQGFHLAWMSNSTQETVLAWTRQQSSFQYGWGRVIFQVDKTSGNLTVTHAPIKVIDAGARQAYASFSQDGDKLHCALGYNPAAGEHAVHHLAFDTATGDATTTPDTAANILTGANLPILDTALTPAIPTTATGSSRRLGPINDHGDILYAEGIISDPDNWRLKVSKLIPAGGTLVPGANGYATAAYKAGMDMPTGFEYRVAIKGFSTAPTADVELGRRFQGAAEGDGTRAWALRLLPTRRLQLNYVTSTGTSNNQPTTVSIPGAWSDDLYIRFRFVANNGAGKATFNFQYSTDQGATYTSLQFIEVSTFSLQATTLPMHVATNQTATLRGVTGVLYANLYDLAGALVASADFRTAWPAGATSYTDPQGTSWSLNGDATVTPGAATRSVWDVFGVMGPRVGYTPEANYIGVAHWINDGRDIVSFPNVGGIGKAIKWKYAAGGWDSSRSRELLADPDNWVGRGHPIIGGGPFETIFQRVISYGASYTDFNANTVAL